MATVRVVCRETVLAAVRRMPSDSVWKAQSLAYDTGNMRVSRGVGGHVRHEDADQRSEIWG